MNRLALTGALAAWLYVGLAALPLAAQTPATEAAAHPSEKSVAMATPAAKCMSDLRAFDNQLEKDGYWLGGAGIGYGYPVGDAFYAAGGYPQATTAGYQNARPGYEVRLLFASANILARNGQQQSCEDVLATTRNIYKQYASDMHKEGIPMADIPAWRRQAIAAAQPINGKDTSFRSDELLGTAVRSPRNEALGSVEDLVMSPKTGKIAYLVIGRGGIFGIDEKYVPVPWADFKATTNMSFLVLDTTEATMGAAPQVSHDEFATGGHFEQQSGKVDAYWKDRIAAKSNN